RWHTLRVAPEVPVAETRSPNAILRHRPDGGRPRKRRLCLTPQFSKYRVAHRKVHAPRNVKEDVVKSRLTFRAAAATGLWLAQLGGAAEPARLPLDPTTPQSVVSLDQQLADLVAERLAQVQLRGYEVDIVSQNGVVE